MSYEFQDITAPDNVQIEIRDDGTVIWIHVEGSTRLRICKIKNLQVLDHRGDKYDEDGELI